MDVTVRELNNNEVSFNLSKNLLNKIGLNIKEKLKVTPINNGLIIENKSNLNRDNWAKVAKQIADNNEPLLMDNLSNIDDASLVW